MGERQAAMVNLKLRTQELRDSWLPARRGHLASLLFARQGMGDSARRLPSSSPSGAKTTRTLALRAFATWRSMLKELYALWDWPCTMRASSSISGAPTGVGPLR
jgi:hypothetical protein